MIGNLYDPLNNDTMALKEASMLKTRLVMSGPTISSSCTANS